MNKVIEVRELYKTYNKNIEALRGISFDVFTGSIHAILGPNGAGKTTIFKILMKFITPDRGRILVVENKAFLPEDKALYDQRTLKYVFSLTREISPYWNEKEARRLLDLFPQDMEKRIGQLSLGERTQFYLILVFSQDVPIYILDEPTIGLDPVSEEKVISLIKKKAIEGKTILYASHHLYSVEEVADTVTILRDGVLIYSGELDLLREKYKDGLKDVFFNFMEGKDEGDKKRDR